MGLIDRILNRKLRADLEKYVSPNVAEKILAHPAESDFEPKEFQSAVVTLILVQLKDDDLHQVPDMIAKTCDILTEHNWVIETIVSSMIVAFIGPPFQTKRDPHQMCEQTANALIQNFSDKVKILHGDVSGKIGNLGSKTRFSFGPLLPNFSLIIKQLGELKFGKTDNIKTQ